eukprot:1334840-Ditylum_brightwellii.AAC.1
MEDWRSWKNRTQCALEGSGFKMVLTNREYASRNPQLNRIVYSQLFVTTSGGTAYHIVKQHEDGKDSHDARKSLIEWYDGDVMKSETANTIRSRLENYKLGLTNDAA